MKMFYSQKQDTAVEVLEDFTQVSINESIEKTRKALDIAYAGFDNALDIDLIDSYIYEINSLQKRYKHLLTLASTQPADTVQKKSHIHSPISALVRHVLG